MNTAPNINLFGGLAISISAEAGQGLKFTSVRAELLIAWLALNPGEHRREKVADLFWDERDQVRSLGNLRTLLARLPKPIKQHLNITTQTIMFDTDQPFAVDLLTFDRLIEAGTKEDAAELLSGEPLAGVSVIESDGLNAWMGSVRETYQQKGIDLLHTLAATSGGRETLANHILYAQKLVRLDPLREASYQVLMRLLARNGQRVEALNVFEQCKQMLADEFFLEPEASTAALAQRLKDGQTARHNLPDRPTRFIGRQAELERLQQHFLGDDHRMVTILGAGGMGKTRLAIACGERLADAFLDGVGYVPLANIGRADQVDYAIYSTLAEHRFIEAGSSNRPIADLLSQALREKEMLLILDNYEHLLDSAPLLNSLLDRCPHLKILVTSRTRLGLRWENLLDLQGLDGTADRSDATELFVQVSKRLVPNLTLSADDRLAIADICDAVGGMPLALELASGWMRLHTIPDILREIQNGIAFLASADRGLPERHRSILAVFDYSWQKLTAAERTSLARLSVFRGRFDFRAAAEITECDQATLASLIDHSLVGRQASTDGNARFFELHALLREFGAERLQSAESAPSIKALEVKHARFYFEQISRFDIKKRADKLDLARFIDAHFDNVHGGWDFVVAHREWDLLAAASDQLYLYWRRRSMNVEGEGLFKAAADASGVSSGIANENHLRFKLQQVKFLYLIGDLDRTIDEIEAVVAPFPADDRPPILAEFFFNWGECYYLKADYKLAHEKLSAGMAIAEAHRSEVPLAWLHRATGKVFLEEGSYEEAESHLQMSVELFQKFDTIEGLSLNYNSLSALYRDVGRLDLALQSVRRSFELSDQNGDEQTSLNSKRNYAFFLTFSGRFRESLAVINELEAIYTHLTSSQKKIGIGRILHVKGVLMSRLGRFAEAEYCFKMALKLANGLKRAEHFNNVRLAILYANWGKPEMAQAHLWDGYRLAKMLGDPYSNRVIRMADGYVALALGEAQAAENAFEQGLEFAYLEKNLLVLIECKAGIATAIQQQGGARRAADLARSLAGDLNDAMLAILFEPISVYVAIINALEHDEPELAAEVLAKVLRLFKSWEEEVPDETSRQSLRSAVPAHRDLLAMRNKLGEG